MQNSTSTTRERFTPRTYSETEFNRTVSGLRSWLRSLARKRVSGTVTADDVHRYLDRDGVRPKQVRTRLRFINSVLRSPNFQYVGETRSTRPAARGRMISEWAA